ncbi:MAG: autotransporter domain-containing protein [Rhodospirillales bacterium]|nr:autotransporter domain-containing protein [Rhodospirillales bacterium]
MASGLSASLDTSQVGGFGGFFQSSSRGITIGPYIAAMLSNNWAVDAALGYSRISNDLGIAFLNANFLSQRLSGAVNLHGQYDLGLVNVRPRLSTGYSRTYSDAYELQGAFNAQVLGLNISAPVNVPFPEASYDYASVEGAVEVNRLFTMANGNRLMPFAEFGALYEFVRPNDGQILTSDLTLAIPSPWSFSTKAGLRLLLSEALLIEARAGYLSFGQSGLDVVEARLHVSFSF